jgi:peptidoglycan/xylan/chitin deacetylase (PgdA/CDA1 family)
MAIFACSLVFLATWFPTQSAIALDKSPQVVGYASDSSVPHGRSINFHTSTRVPKYNIQIFREGANGRKLMMTLKDLPGKWYACQDAYGVPVDKDGNPLGCNWPVAYTLNVPYTWPSGLYLADLLDADDQPGGYGSYIYFIVTENQPGSTSDIIFHVPTNTWQAYNPYGGWSLYTDPRAVKLTFDRPYKPDYRGRHKWQVPLVRWLESEGYAVEYVASEDIHNEPNLLFNYTLFLSVGHDEYWSKEMRDHLDAFLGAGGNCAIFSGNTLFRQVRYEDGGRTLVGYKLHWRDDPMYKKDNIRVTRECKNYPINWPQNSTTGLGWTGWVNKSPESPKKGRYTVYRSNHWIYDGTGLKDLDEFWYEPTEKVEVDGSAFFWENGLPIVSGEEETPLNFIILGIQPSTRGHATLGIYAHPGGGTVFNAATFGWSRGLIPEYNPEDYKIVQQITRNVINSLSSSSPPSPPPTSPPPGNQRPNVDAGSNQAITLPDDSAFIEGTVTDDYLPNPPGIVTTTWSQVSGPGTVSFDNAFAVDTRATFPQAGTYVLQLKADDGKLTATDRVTIVVNQAGENDLPTIIISTDDLVENTKSTLPVSNRFIRFVDIIETNNIKASIGIICKSLARADQEYFNWINAVYRRGHIEFWMHGYDHKKWEADGMTYYEFQNTALWYQKSHMEKALEIAKETLTLTLVAFKSPFGRTDENTIRAFEKMPEIKIWIYGPPKAKFNNGIKLLRGPVKLERSVGNPDFDEFKAKYERNLGLDYIVLSGHPRCWDDHDFNEFERTINYLREKGSIFMTPTEYYYSIQ